VTSFAVQQGRAPLADRKDDLYETPIEAVRALIATGELPASPARIWEPAAGRGAIHDPLREAGFDCYGSDLVDYGKDWGGHDFLMEWKAPPRVDVICTNPPFKLADAFVRHALTLAPKVIMLLRWAYAEGAGRSDIIDGHLARVWLGKERLPFMHRDGYDGPKNSNSGAPFAWFVFEQQKRIPDSGFVVRRISWRDA